MKTQVVIIGTIHLSASLFPHYGSWVRQSVKRLHPDIVCVELSPEQLAGETSMDSKPEYSSAILPSAREIGAILVPIQPVTSVGEEFERVKLEFLEYIASDNLERERWEVFCQLESAWLTGLTVWLQDVPSIIDLQDIRLDTLLFEPWYSTLSRFFPGFEAFWRPWNQELLGATIQAVRSHPGRLILITVGMAHRYWLRKGLRAQEEVELRDLREF